MLLKARMDAATFNSTDSVRKGKGKHGIFLLWGFASGQASWPFSAPATASCVCPALEDGRACSSIETSTNLQQWTTLPGAPIPGANTTGTTTVTGRALPTPVTDRLLLRVRRAAP